MILPGEVIDDLRDYAKALGLPSDWQRSIHAVITDTPIDGTRVVKISHAGRPLADYTLGCLSEITEAQRHVPIPAPPDPVVVATQCALSQPADSQWRRFRHLTFRREDVMFVNNADKNGDENGEEFTICFRSGQQLVCGNEKNYRATGMSTCEFFLQHVMLLPSGEVPTK